MAGKNTKGIAMKRLVGALVALLAFTAVAQAQAYPTRPITMLVGFPPGGPTDTLARILADAMQPSLGQSVVVETVSGASGTIASGRVVHASPDGYTIGIGNWTSHVGSPAIYPLDYDILKDLQPVALLAASPLWIVGKNDLPPKTAPELITWLKARPDPATFGTIGSGSAAHLCGLFFAQKTGARFQYVPYRGGAPAMQDLIGGQIDLSCLEASQTLANVEAGRFKAYAVMGEQRWAKSPNTPTMIELGVPGLSISFWHGLVDHQGDAQGRRRSPRCRRQGGAGQSRRAGENRSPRPGHIPGRSAEPASARGLPQGRARQVVADHQVGRHQSRRLMFCLFACGGSRMR